MYPSDIVIVSAVRTPVGAFNGALRAVPADELGAAAITRALVQAHIAPGDVD
jgi:acetyl-CoA C-acetyltransferase